jgi:hypothetical protein
LDGLHEPVEQAGTTPQSNIPDASDKPGSES